MNYKSLVIIALALCLCVVPALAAPIWSAGNYVTDGRYDNCDSVKYNPQTDVYSCYRDNNPVNEIKASLEGNGGIAVGSIRAGYSTLSNRIEVRNVLQEANSTGKIIEVLPDATFRIPKEGDGVLAPGNYTAALDNFNLPDETMYFTIAANQQEPTRIAFLGQAASQPAVTKCQRSILKAAYCGVTIPAVTHEEYRYWISSHDHQCVPGLGEGCGAWAKEISVDTSHWSDWQIENPHRHGQQSRTVIDTPAVTGGCADVTSNAREALSQGYTKFLFDNSAPHHGIYDITTTTLLSDVEDPAVGIVKDVSITYTTCSGVEQTIQGKEYQAISLN